jgi:hypothetical protein
MLILNMFIYKLFYEKNNPLDIIILQMYEIAKMKMHFQLNYLIFLLNFFYRWCILGKFSRMKFISFHLDKAWRR